MVTRRAMRSLPAVRGVAPGRSVLLAVAKTQQSKNGGGSPTVGRGDSRDNWGAPSMVIAAFVRAKLFGIKILTLDARIVLAPADESDVRTLAVRARSVAPASDKSSPRLAHRSDLAHAVRLLEEGSKSLEEVRGLTKSGHRLA